MNHRFQEQEIMDLVYAMQRSMPSGPSEKLSTFLKERNNLLRAGVHINPRSYFSLARKYMTRQEFLKLRSKTMKNSQLAVKKKIKATTKKTNPRIRRMK